MPARKMNLNDSDDERLTGNTAKIQVLEELSMTLEKNTGDNVKILDVGCVGRGQPLDLWRPLLSNPDYSSKFKLWGIDTQGIERAEQFLQERGWGTVELRQASAYELQHLYPGDFFDTAVSTQVLEHIKYPSKFFDNIYQVTKKDGYVYLTLDSAHYPRKITDDGLRALLRRIRGRVWDALGREGYHDVPLYDTQVETLCNAAGFQVVDKKFYCLHPLKEIHNQKVSDSLRNKMLSYWKELEDLLNSDKEFIEGNKHYFMALYYKLRKS